MAVDNNYSNYFANRGVSAATYDTFTLPKYLIDVFDKDVDVSILDFGCGFGQNLKALYHIGFNDLTGYDIEPNAIKFCIENNINVIDGRAVNLKAVSKRFDFIIATHVLEHIPKNLIIETLRELRNLLSDNGKIFVAVPNAQSNTSCYWRYEDFTHTTLFTAGSLFYVLREAGYTDIELRDKDCLAGLLGFKRVFKKLLLKTYRANNTFWNRVTSSSYHQPSPVVNSYEIKMLAKK